MSDTEFVGVVVRAIFTMLPEKESGINTPVTSDLRPNHNFLGEGNPNMCIGRVDVDNDEWIYPGESKNVTIHFALLPEYAKLVKKGFKWRIQGGSHHFANGEIIDVLSP